LSGIIYLIVEDATDCELIRAILSAKKISVQVKPIISPGKTGGISRLSSKIDDLIRDAKTRLKEHDCIAVLYDADQHTDPNQTHQKKIVESCKQHKIKHIPAQDEVEAWVLADSGVCKWLNQKQKNWDEARKPKDTLDTWLKNNRKPSYYSGGRQDVLKNLVGDGDKYSDSMRAALKLLEGAACLK